LRIICLLFGLTVSAVSAAPAQPQVAIIIDDIGYQKVDPDLIRLPFALTLAVMPYTPHGKAMLQLAKQHQKELMLHMPMEAVAQNHLLGQGALRQHMDKATVQQKVQAALAEVPGVIGVNNHMGSLFTTLTPQMDWVMEVVASQGLYFIDSKTSGRSVVSASAVRFAVEHRSRDVFLDNDKSYAALDRQFMQLIQQAKRHGSAIAIGHPYPETYRYLKKNLPRLAAAGIELVPVSVLLQRPESADRQIQAQPDPLVNLDTSAAKTTLPSVPTSKSQQPATGGPATNAQTDQAMAMETTAIAIATTAEKTNSAEVTPATDTLVPDTPASNTQAATPSDSATAATTSSVLRQPWRLPYQADSQHFVLPKAEVTTPPAWRWLPAAATPAAMPSSVLTPMQEPMQQPSQPPMPPSV